MAARDPIVPSPLHQPVTPYGQKLGTPEVGEQITLSLPGETLRAIVRGVVGDALCVELAATPVSPRSIGYSKGDIVNAMKATGDHGLPIWRLLSDHDLEQDRMRAQIAVEEERREAEDAKERVRQIRERDLERQAQAERDRIERENNASPPPDSGNWSA